MGSIMAAPITLDSALRRSIFRSERTVAELAVLTEMSEHRLEQFLLGRGTLTLAQCHSLCDALGLRLTVAAVKVREPSHA